MSVLLLMALAGASLLAYAILASYAMHMSSMGGMAAPGALVAGFAGVVLLLSSGIVALVRYVF